MKRAMVLGFFLASGLVLGAQDEGLVFKGISLSCFNDNTPYLRQTGDALDLGFGRGPDDQFSFGLRLESTLGLKTPWTDYLLLAFSLGSFTDTQYYYFMRHGYPLHDPWRMDVGSAQVLAEKSWDSWSLALGTGLLARGNLGSSALQNGFHTKLGIPTLNINYRDDPALGAFLAGVLQWKIIEAPWLDWTWKPRLGVRGILDPWGVLTQELSFLGTLKLERPGLALEFTAGRRLSWPGTRDFLREMYSGGLFWDGTLELRFGPAAIQLGYTLNPFGAAGIPAYIYDDQNQSFHWSLVLGQDGPLPWAWRFFP